MIKSPADRLSGKRGDLAVLVDGHDQSLLCASTRDPPQYKVEPVPADDYRLRPAPGLDLKALRRTAREMFVERCRP